MTVEAFGAEMIELVPELKSFVPPAVVFDKKVYSPWSETSLHAYLTGHAVDTLVISGSETDVCVLSTVLGAVDRGYRVVIAIDALCSSSDEAHDASIRLYETRYAQQVEAVTSDVILASWRRSDVLASTVARDAKVARSSLLLAVGGSPRQNTTTKEVLAHKRRPRPESSAQVHAACRRPGSENQESSRSHTRHCATS